MICPYICNIRQQTKIKFIYEDETWGNKIAEEIHSLQELKEPMTCKEKDCGAWDKKINRCRYIEVEE